MRTLITGAISGIGLATSKLFLERGWTVVMVDKTEKSDIINSLKNIYNDSVHFIKTDISKDGDVKKLHENTSELINDISCIVNNAGIITHGLLHETSESDWDKIMDTDVKSIYLTSKYFIPDLIKKDGGTIVNITRAMALDYAQFNIRVNSVCPGATDTPMLNPDNIPKYACANPMKRICTPEEIAKAVYFLASDESSYCNGVNLPVTGGLDVHSGQPK